MAKMSTEDLERKLRALRLKTSPALDARIKEMCTRAERDAAGDKVPRPHRITPLRFRPIVAAALLAAVCAVALTAWWLLGRPGFGPSAYAQLMEALENSRAAEWVHLQATANGSEQEMWLAFTPFRFFVKTDGKVEAVDLEHRRLYTYDPDTRTVTIDDDIDEVPATLEKISNFYEYVMACLDRSQEHGVEVTSCEEVIEGKQYTVFTIEHPKTQLRVIVDPETKHIRGIEAADLFGKPGSGAARFRVDYAAKGPSEILARYELHVAAWQLVETGLAALIRRRESSGNS